MKRLFSFAFLLTTITGYGQQVYTLQSCIDSALASNISVRQFALLRDAAEVNWRQSRMNILPNLNLDVNHGLNAGRSIDPFTNTYVTQSVNTADYGLSSGLVVFNGGLLQNRIRENATAYDASKMEWQQKRDQIVLMVIAAYLRVLSSEDQVQLAIQQAKRTDSTMQRLQILNNQGAIKPSDLSDVKGQLMADQLSRLNAENQLASDKLLLSQLMNKNYDPNMRLDRGDINAVLAPYNMTADDIYANALRDFSAVRAAMLRRQSAAYSVRAARGQLYPQVALFAGLNSNYSSIARDAAGKIPYSSQIRNNRFTSVGVGLRVPIFNGSLARSRVKLAAITLKNTELLEENTRIILRQEIDQAYLDMSNAFEKYKLLLEQVNAYETSFQAAEVRFKSGVGTSIDYLTAKDRLDQAQLNLLNSKYDFVLRTRVLDYYNSKAR